MKTVVLVINPTRIWTEMCREKESHLRSIREKIWDVGQHQMRREGSRWQKSKEMMTAGYRFRKRVKQV